MLTVALAARSKQLPMHTERQMLQSCPLHTCIVQVMSCFSEVAGAGWANA